jgi:hypothetical protein
MNTEISCFRTSGTGTIGIFAIQRDGPLNNVGNAGGLSESAGFNGIAAN